MEKKGGIALSLIIVIVVFIIGIGIGIFYFSNNATVQGGYVYYEGFEYNSEKGFCILRGTENIPGKNPFEFENIVDCEKGNNVEIPEIDVDTFCTNEVNEIDEDAYQYQSSIKNIRNNCYFDFALATRNTQLCESIDDDREYKKGLCYEQIANIPPDDQIGNIPLD